MSLPLHSSAMLGRDQHTGTICPKLWSMILPKWKDKALFTQLRLGKSAIPHWQHSTSQQEDSEKEEDRERRRKREHERDLAFSITLTRNNPAKQPRGSFPFFPEFFCRLPSSKAPRRLSSKARCLFLLLRCSANNATAKA